MAALVSNKKGVSGALLLLLDLVPLANDTHLFPQLAMQTSFPHMLSSLPSRLLDLLNLGVGRWSSLLQHIIPSETYLVL